MKPQFSLIIRWSQEDNCYIAWAPEFGFGVTTHGDTYEAAAKAGHEMIESMIELHESEHLPLPEPWLFLDPEIDEKTGHQLLPKNDAYMAPAPRSRNAKVKNATA